MQGLLNIALDWALRCFGYDHMHDNMVRALRAGEESIEFMQAVGVPREKVELLVRSVYSRPKGEPHRELSQAIMTLYLFCAANGLDPTALFETELRRVLAKREAVFAERNREKTEMGLT